MIAIGFFGIFLAVGVGLLYFMTIKPWLSIREAQSWDATPCIILSSEVKAHRGDDSTTYSIEVTYEYNVADRTLTGDQYSFFSMNSNSRKWREDAVRQIPPGTETVCYVNPEDIRQSVLSRDWTPDWGWGFFPLPFALIGFSGISWILYSLSVGKSPFGPAPVRGDKRTPHNLIDLGSAHRATSGGRIFAWSQSDFDDDDLREPPGPVTLRPESSPLVIFVVLTFAALFWNGILSLFVVPRIGAILQGNWNWGDVFFVPFVLAGIGLLLGALHQLLASFNPVPTLTLSRQWIPLGSSAVLSWTFTGNTSAIRLIKVTLEGQEEATYRRGTNTVTDKSIFFQKVLFEATDPFEIREGAEQQVNIPTDTMHSLNGQHNKIVWRLTFQGEIPFWPDVHLAFPIRVMPHESIAD